MANPHRTVNSVPFRSSHKNQKPQQVINTLASLPRRGLMLISLSHLCFLFSWHSLIFHNAGNSTLFDQNSLKLSNEFQLPIYLVFQLVSPPWTFQAISKLGLKPRVSNPLSTLNPLLFTPPGAPHPDPHPSASSSPRPGRFLLSVILRPSSAGSREADVIRQLCNPSGAQK